MTNPNRISQTTIARSHSGENRKEETMDNKRAFDMALSVLKLVLSSEQIKTLEREVCDLIERKVKESTSKVDDALVLPVLQIVRAALGISK